MHLLRGMGDCRRIRNFGVGLFSGIPPTFDAVRYHSLAVTDVPETLEVTASSDDGVVMGLRHRSLPQWGVQFHPESISTEHSLALLGNFARLTREWAGGETEASTAETRSSGTPSTGTSDRPEPVTVALHVEALELSVPDESIFAALYGNEEEAVWLDGNDPSSGSSRFAIMGAPTGPNGRVATADTSAGTIHIATPDVLRPIRQVRRHRSAAVSSTGSKPSWTPSTLRLRHCPSTFASAGSDTWDTS